MKEGGAGEEGEGVSEEMVGSEEPMLNLEEPMLNLQVKGQGIKHEMGLLAEKIKVGCEL